MALSAYEPRSEVAKVFYQALYNVGLVKLNRDSVLFRMCYSKIERSASNWPRRGG